MAKTRLQAARPTQVFGLRGSNYALQRPGGSRCSPPSAERARCADARAVAAVQSGEPGRLCISEAGGSCEVNRSLRRLPRAHISHVAEVVWRQWRSA
jgi:hypothetical protein